MPRLTVKVPKDRHHKASGQAVVGLNGRDVYLGPFNSANSKAKYKPLIAEWELGGRNQPPTQDSESVTVDDLILGYLKHVETYYVKNGRPTTSQHQIRSAFDPLHELYGTCPATQIGPLALKALRQRMIERGTWCRSTINTAIGIIKRLFKWATENELIAAEVFHALQSVNERRAAAAARRKTHRSCGNRPGTNRMAEPKCKPGDCYAGASYRRAIERACDQAFPLPEPVARRLVPKGQRESMEAYRARLTAEDKRKIIKWRQSHRWHPHQLRHAAATIIRREFGLEAARIALGHSRAACVPM